VKRGEEYQMRRFHTSPFLTPFFNYNTIGIYESSGRKNHRFERGSNVNYFELPGNSLFSLHEAAIPDIIGVEGLM
jgi:hypothetical protein